MKCICLSLCRNIYIVAFKLEVYSPSVKHLGIPSNEYFSHLVAWPLENYGSLIFWISLIMSSFGGILLESPDPSKFPTSRGGFYTSILIVLCPFHVALISSRECKMSANSGDGNELFGVGHPYVDPPWYKFSCFLTVLNHSIMSMTCKSY